MKDDYYTSVLWPHYMSCPSICLSIHLSVPIKIAVDILQGTSKWNAIFQVKRSKVKVTGRQNLHSIVSWHGVMFTYGHW